MNVKKLKVIEKIRPLVKNGCITKKEIDNMFRSEYGLKQLMLNSDKSIKEIKTSICNTQQQFNITYEHNYSKFSVSQIQKLSKILKVKFDDLVVVIAKDIEIQESKNKK